jgi:hypothetical protein
MADERLELLEQRRWANVGKQVDNAALPAGADMYYYCWGCGTLTATKPEGWWQDPPPPKFCGDCRPLVDEALIEDGHSYDEWLREHDKPPVPR